MQITILKTNGKMAVVKAVSRVWIEAPRLVLEVPTSAPGEYQREDLQCLEIKDPNNDPAK